MRSSAKRPASREEKKQECRQAIAQAAVSLFEQKGFDATTMDEIAQAAGVSRPTVFNYFARKEDILEALGVMISARFKAQVEDMRASGMFADPVSALRHLLVTMATGFAEYPQTARAFHFLRVQEVSRSPKGTISFIDDSPLPEQKHLVLSLIEQAQATGQIRKDVVPRELLYHLFIGLFASTMGPWYHGEFGEESLPSLISRFFDLYVSGIRGQ